MHGAWCMVHGAWCMVHGAWCMVHSDGAWYMVHGAWCMARDAWCMANGEWCMVHGAWCIARDAWCMAHGAWCMVQVNNSSMQGVLATFGSWIASDGWENMNRAPLIGFMLSVLVAAAVMMTCDLVTRGTWIILAHMKNISHACASTVMWMACQPCGMTCILGLDAAGVVRYAYSQPGHLTKSPPPAHHLRRLSPVFQRHRDCHTPTDRLTLECSCLGCLVPNLVDAATPPEALSTVALLASLSQWEWPFPKWLDAILSTP
eukprot:357265-Chlamydomonas_euryale.AAC.3